MDRRPERLLSDLNAELRFVQSDRRQSNWLNIIFPGCAIIRPPRDGGIRYRGLTQEQVQRTKWLHSNDKSSGLEQTLNHSWFSTNSTHGWRNVAASHLSVALLLLPRLRRLGFYLSVIPRLFVKSLEKGAEAQWSFSSAFTSKTAVINPVSYSFCRIK